MTQKSTLWGISLLAGLGMAAAAQAEPLTVVGWGSVGQEVQTKIYFDPFAKDTNTAIQQDSWGGGYGILKSKVETGNVNWDVVQVEADEEALGCLDDIYVPLDWSKIGNKADFLPGTATDCGVGVITWSFSLAYDDSVVKEKPQSWAAMWDTKTWPGKRALRKSAKGTLEVALLADGVPADQLYDVLGTPEGVDRAFKKLDEIKPDLLWWTSGAQVLQMLSAGQVVMTSAYDGSLRRYAAAENKPFELTFNQALYASDYWVILKGTQHEKEAQDLIAYMSNSDRMAQYPALLPYGVPNTVAMSKVSPDVSKTLLTSPDNIKNAIPLNTEFWIDNGEELNKRFNAWLAQ